MRGGRVETVDLMEDDCGPGEGTGFETEGGCYAVTKGRKTVGKVTMVVAGEGGIRGRELGEEMVVEKRTLSEEDEREWVERWSERGVY